MHDTHRDYLPAAGSDWALPLYDPMQKLLGADRARQKLLDQAALDSNARVLDIGCGTGTFVTVIKRSHPSVDVVGLDPDPKALARARRKAARAGVSVRFDEGFSDHLPYPDASFDRVFSSLMFHHIPDDQRPNSLREIRRVLKPGASFHLVDFSRPDGGRHRLKHLACASSHFQANSDSRILSLFQQAGFANPKKTGEGTMFLALLRLAYFTAST
ncbi:MAG TPA: methyltransferase domain-containing protein [Candidatus Acidoferrum sp.]|nr:methyltransferase domain-containing protein [Candidatus Acidoferrum sp.]